MKCICCTSAEIFSFKNSYDSDPYIKLWKSTGLNNYSTNSNMLGVAQSDNNLPILIDNGRMNLKFDGCYMKQTKLIRPNNNNVNNVYIVYKPDPISSLRSETYTVQNELLGGVKITKNATDTSKHKYEGYGICFDEGGTFSKGSINNGKNVLIF